MKVSGQLGRAIQPGKTEEIKVSLTLKGRAGQYSKRIPVQTNDPDNRNVMLTCKTRTLVAMKIDPQLVNFGLIPYNAESRTKTVTITRGDGGPLALELLATKNQRVTSVLREIEPGQRYELDVTINAPWPRRRLYANLSVKTGIAEAPTESIRVMAKIEQRLKSMPERFTIPRRLPVEKEFSAQLVWSGENPGKILSATCSDPTLKARIEERDGQPFVHLTVPADYSHRPGTVPSVIVKTDDEVAPKLSIPVIARIDRSRGARPPAVPRTSGAPLVGPPRPARLPSRAPTSQPSK